MNNKGNLYFIAILTDTSISEIILKIKEYMAVKYNSKSALKSPAHITLIPPFKLNKNEEHEIIELLNEFSGKQSTCHLELSNFGCFTPKVIYINVNSNETLLKQQNNLLLLLKNKFPKIFSDFSFRFHPHITIATRDLDKINFTQAWKEFIDKSFTASFKVTSFVLLKHNGTIWDIYRKFSLK